LVASLPDRIADFLFISEKPIASFQSGELTIVLARFASAV
jgi:hypothetical protein